MNQPFHFLGRVRENFRADDGRLPERKSEKGEKNGFQENSGPGPQPQTDS